MPQNKKVKVHRQPKLKPPRHDLRKIQVPEGNKPKPSRSVKMFKLKRKRAAELAQVVLERTRPYLADEEISLSDLNPNAPLKVNAEVAVRFASGSVAVGRIVRLNPKAQTAHVLMASGVIVYAHFADILTLEQARGMV